jgi:hypothetical protein
LATTVYRDYVKELQKNPGATLPRESLDERKEEYIQAFKVAFLATVVTGWAWIPKNIHADISNYVKLRVSAEAAPDLETFIEAEKGNPALDALIAGSTWADFSRAFHEFAHVLRRQFRGELLAEAERVFGVKDGVWVVVSGGDSNELLCGITEF